MSWKCSNPLNYQSYERDMLIGDQCWFAENLRSVNDANGDSEFIQNSPTPNGHLQNPAHSPFTEKKQPLSRSI